MIPNIYPIPRHPKADSPDIVVRFDKGLFWLKPQHFDATAFLVQTTSRVSGWYEGELMVTPRQYPPLVQILGQPWYVKQLWPYAAPTPIEDPTDDDL